MKNVLVIGSTGQIGSELTKELRSRYGNNHVVAGYIKGAEPKGELLESGPAEECDVTNGEMIANVVKKHNIDAIYNLAALLSVVAENKPRLAWKIGIDGLWNVLEVARENHCQVFTPSSIGSFGPNTPKWNTPQDTIQRPQTIYGVSKVTTELLSDWFFHKYGVDTRSVRFPGLISYVTPPGGGTTDYAVDIYYSAVKGEKFVQLDQIRKSINLLSNLPSMDKLDVRGIVRSIDGPIAFAMAPSFLAGDSDATFIDDWNMAIAFKSTHPQLVVKSIVKFADEMGQPDMLKDGKHLFNYQGMPVLVWAEGTTVCVTRLDHELVEGSFYDSSADLKDRFASSPIGFYVQSDVDSTKGFFNFGFKNATQGDGLFYTAHEHDIPALTFIEILCTMDPVQTYDDDDYVDTY